MFAVNSNFCVEKMTSFPPFLNFWRVLIMWYIFVICSLFSGRSGVTAIVRRGIVDMNMGLWRLENFVDLVLSIRNLALLTADSDNILILE